MGSMEIAFLLLTGSFAATFCSAFTTSAELRSLSVPFSFHAPNDALVQGDLSDALVGLSAASVANEGAVFDSVASVKAAEVESSVFLQPPSIVTASSVDDGKTLTLYEYVLSGGSAVSDGEGSSRLANAQDKLGLINDNLNSFLRDLNLPDSNDFAALLKQVFEKGVGAITSIGDGSGSDFQVQFAALSSGLSLEQNAAWYAAGVALFLALGQRGAGKADARSEFEAELAGAKKKADEAIGAAALAAKGAAIAKEVASQIEPQSNKSDGTASSTMLENSRVRQMSVETEIMKDELKKLKNENEKLRMQLSGFLQNKTLDAPRQTKTSQTPPQKVVDRDPEENEKLLEIIKEVEMANRNAGKSRKKPEKAKVEEVKSEASLQAPVKTRAKVPVKASAKAPAKASAKTPAKTPAKASAKASAKAPATTKGGTKDWSQLSDSTLKRKTIAQLKEYLTEQGILNDDAKKMKKSDMISLVKSG